jgi:polysaccharide biosynthesis transport protein
MQTSPDDIDLASLGAAIMRNRWRLLVSSLAAGAVTYGILSTMHSLYTSQASVIVEEQGSDYARAKGGEARPADSKVDDVEVASQVEIVRASDSLLKIARDLKLDKNPEINTVLEPAGFLSVLGIGDQRRMSTDERMLANIESRLRVYQLAKTRLISIDFTSRTPQFAADVANAVAQAYLARSRAAGLRDAVDATESLGAKIDDVRGASEAAQAELEKFRSAAGLLAGQNNVTFVTQQLSELNSQRTQIDTAVGEAVARARLVREMLAQGDIEAAPEVLRSANMQQLFQQRIRIERDIAELSSTLLPAHPRMRQLGSELATVKNRIQEDGRKVARSLDNEAEVARARQAGIVKSIADLTKQQGASSDAQARLGVLEREAQSKREIYQTVLDRLNDASTRRDALSAPARARLNAAATVSSIPVFPKKTSFSLLAMLGTLLAGLALVITRELIVAARTGNRRQAQREASAVSIQVPWVQPAVPYAQPNGYEHSGPTVRQPTILKGAQRVTSLAQVAELVIGQAGQGTGYRSLLTDAGATVDISHYGLGLARLLTSRGKKVVLIDWDAASPGVSARLRLQPTPGLRELAGHSVAFEDVIQADPKSPVHVIGAGGPLSLADGELANRHLAKIFDGLDELYEHVIVLAPEAAARTFFERLDGRIDAGIRVQTGATYQEAGRNTGFLGYDVPTVTEIVLQPHASDRANWQRGNGSAEMRASAIGR